MKAWLNRATIVLALIGSAVLYFSFQATSSSRSTVVDANGVTWICQGAYFFPEGPGGMDWHPPATAPLDPKTHMYLCPPGVRRSIAVVTLEWPGWAPWLGFILIMASGLGQLVLTFFPK